MTKRSRRTENPENPTNRNGPSAAANDLTAEDIIKATAAASAGVPGGKESPPRPLAPPGPAVSAAKKRRKDLNGGTRKITGAIGRRLKTAQEATVTALKGVWASVAVHTEELRRAEDAVAKARAARLLHTRDGHSFGPLWQGGALALMTAFGAIANQLAALGLDLGPNETVTVNVVLTGSELILTYVVARCLRDRGQRAWLYITGGFLAGLVIASFVMRVSYFDLQDSFYGLPAWVTALLVTVPAGALLVGSLYLLSRYDRTAADLDKAVADTEARVAQLSEARRALTEREAALSATLDNALANAAGEVQIQLAERGLAPVSQTRLVQELTGFIGLKEDDAKGDERDGDDDPAAGVAIAA